jgi:formylglycine-generating enzyme required for sulfatase activity
VDVEQKIADSDFHWFTILAAGEAPGTPAPSLTAIPSTETPMVLIPAGSFQMGGMWCSITSGGTCLEKKPDEKNPPHTVTLDAYTIDQYEVTNAQYAECVAARQCRPPDFDNFNHGEAYYGARAYANYPMTLVTWYDAEAYCTWRGARLPSEAEWEKAARGGLELKFYPWGDEEPDCILGAVNGAQSEKCHPGDTLHVGSFAANGYGLFDMAGNVSEWVNDWFQEDYYTVSPSVNPPGPETGATKVIRGGSFDSDHYLYLKVDHRSGYFSQSVSLPSIGFRCAADAH